MDLFLFIDPAEHKENTADHGDHSKDNTDYQRHAADGAAFLAHIYPNLPHSHAHGYQTEENAKHIFHKLPSGNQKSLGALIDHYESAVKLQQINEISLFNRKKECF
jgi:glucose-6-phosphate isomerase